MKRGLVGSIAAVLALCGLAAGCAHSNGAAAAVRVVSNAQEVAGCQKLSLVRLSGTWTKSGGKSQLEELVRSKGGNVLLLTDGSASEGEAYRCGGAAGGAP